MEELALLLQGCRVHIADMTVVIPLYVFNICAREHLVNALDNILSHLGTSEVKDKLISAQGTRPALDTDSPLGMCAVKVAVRDYTLGLKPESELHTHLIDLLYNIFYAAGKLLEVFHPVAKTCKIVITLAKPTVIQNEHLYS